MANKSNSFPDKFPFWARLKINKNRTTLVISKADVYDHKKKKQVSGFKHRESIHVNESDLMKLNKARKKGYERIFPNPDKNDLRAMYLKKPSVLPQSLFKPHNKKLDMPKYLLDRYSNKK